MGEPTLHLAIGVYSETGIDLMGWLQDHLRNNAAFRMNLPASRPSQPAAGT